MSHLAPARGLDDEAQREGLLRAVIAPVPEILRAAHMQRRCTKFGTCRGLCPFACQITCMRWLPSHGQVLREGASHFFDVQDVQGHSNHIHQAA